jgi:hypothetical protein
MKKLFIFIALLLFIGNAMFAQVGINTNNSAPDASAGLDVNFTNKGFLPPRVALAAINSALPVTDPAAGLLVYNTAVVGTPPNNVFTGYYFWNGVKWIPVAAPQGTNVGDMQYWDGTQWVKIPVGANGQILTLTDGIPTWGQSTSLCGMSLTVYHEAGVVAPVTKTTTYGTVNGIAGETSKCWITNNLGTDHQATSVSDATEASAGWYWQFNRKQGYKHDGTTRTPNTTWINTINEISDWITANDPCCILLGASWRIPTYTEWYNVDNIGGWTTWTGPWGSGLKLHAAGYLYNSNGSLGNRGSTGYYWSSTQGGTTYSWALNFYSLDSFMTTYFKAQGISVRCVREY